VPHLALRYVKMAMRAAGHIALKLPPALAVCGAEAQVPSPRLRDARRRARLI